MSTKQRATPATHVRITFEPQCEVHGWIPGEVYPTLPSDGNVLDDNGQEIYVMSLKWNHSVYLSPSEYELVKKQEVENGD